MSELRISQLGQFREALAEAARTDETNAAKIVARFIELRPGIADKLVARRHHLIAGRRGTGKSTLLHVVRERLRKEGSPVAVVDMERFKGREFPDVLIEILIALLDELRPSVGWFSWQDLRLRHRFNKMHKELGEVLSDPQSTTRTVKNTASRNRKGWAGGRLGGGYGPTKVLLDASSSKERSESHATTAEFEELKIERLRQLAGQVASILAELVKRTKGARALIFIDDYYYVHLNDQPNVLDYLHQVCKGTGVWLKIGGVGSRLNPFVDGDPPIGMQPTQDIDRLTLDVTLDDFGTAQRFLEKMLEGVVEQLKVTAPQIFTQTARSRMVLACGGAVARDYITLTDAALDAAVERLSKAGTVNPEATIKINSADVHRAARKRMNNKEEEELALDAGSDAGRLKERWQDVCDFIRESGGIAFILVRQKDLDQEHWGREIQQLENLRLVHRIRDAVPNTLTWRGVKTMAFMIDLGQVADQRLRAGIPEFWKGAAEFDKLRRAEWVYTPGWGASKRNRRAEWVYRGSSETSPAKSTTYEPEGLFPPIDPGSNVRG